MYIKASLKITACADREMRHEHLVLRRVLSARMYSSLPLFLLCLKLILFVIYVFLIGVVAWGRTQGCGLIGTLTKRGQHESGQLRLIATAQEYLK